MTYNMEEVGKCVREERQKLHLSQDALGKKLGIVGKQISNYENGKLFPPIDVLLKMCELFNCELGYLLREPEYLSGTKVETEIINSTGLTKDSLDNIRKITGNESRCIEFGHCSDEYGSILNRVLSSDKLISIMESLHELERYYSVLNGSVWNEAERKIGKERLEKALCNYNSTYDFEHSNVQLSDEECMDYRLVDKIIDKQRNAEFSAKICRYDVWENFEALIEEMYPKFNRMHD